MPSATRDELVCSRDGGFPVLFFESAVAVALLEPVGRAEDGARTEEEVGRHDEGWYQDQKGYVQR